MVIYGYKYLHLLIFINISTSSNISGIRGVSGFMTDSDACFIPQNSQHENLNTCKHDVCICVTSAICILLLIPPSGKVITLLSCQTLPKNRQICFLHGHVFMDMKERKSPRGKKQWGFAVNLTIHFTDINIHLAHKNSL